jgi:hypothetical protein
VGGGRVAVSRVRGSARMMSSAEWFEMRAMINHDQLLNRILNAFRAPSDDGLVSRDALRPYVILLLDRESEWRAFLARTAEVLRPGQWLSRECQLSFGDSVSTALAEFVDFEFDMLTSINERTTSALLALGQVSQLASRALEEGPECDRTLRTDLPDSVRRLSESLTLLPGSMMAVVESMQ